MEIKLSHGHGSMGQKRTRMHDDTNAPDANLAEMTDTDDSPEEAYFRYTVFYVFIDNFVAGLTLHLRLLSSWMKILISYGNIPQCLEVS